MKDNVGQYYSLDGELYSADTLKSLHINDTNQVYEVIRVINGIALFFEDHLERLQHSLTLINRTLSWTSSDMRTYIDKLAAVVDYDNFNVKIIVYSNGNNQRILIYIPQSYYPSHQEVENGVAVSLLHWQRKNPNAKIVDPKYKEIVSKKIKTDNVFELLLINEKQEITEGSKSNLFALQGTTIYTASSGQVLEGITRKYVLKVCQEAGFKVIERAISVANLAEIDGIFLSGTSIKVLPISLIEQQRIETPDLPAFIQIRDGFEQLINNYLAQVKI